jgi:hypothetical protein
MISGMRRWLAGMILLAVGTPIQAETSASEFLELSRDRQAAYVAGILQGMSYVMFNYDRAGYERWDACVRAQSLDATVGDVLRLLKESPNESRSPVPWAVTRAVSKRC